MSKKIKLQIEKPKNVILLVLIICYSINTYGQQPKWLSPDYRAIKYSEEVFLTSFTQDKKQAGETMADALDRVKDIVRADIAKNVITKIESVSKLYSEDKTINNSETFVEVFQSAIKTETNAEINGIKIDNYFDTENNAVYAIAYANKFEIIGYYKANISLNIQQIEGHIMAAEQLLAASEKSKAKKEYLKTVPLFAKLEYAQGLLIAIDKTTDENSLQTKKSIDYRIKVSKALAELEQGIYIYIECDSQLFENPSTLLENKLKSQLAKQGCSFTRNLNEADWIINIEASARKFSNPNQGIYFSYVDANINLTKKLGNKNVYQDEVKQKGGSRGYKEAAQKAYEEIAMVLATNFLKWINK